MNVTHEELRSSDEVLDIILRNVNIGVAGGVPYADLVGIVIAPEIATTPPGIVLAKQIGALPGQVLVLVVNRAAAVKILDVWMPDPLRGAPSGPVVATIVRVAATGVSLELSSINLHKQSRHLN